MNTFKVIVILFVLLIGSLNASNVGSLHFGVIGGGANISFLGWIEINPKLDPEKIVIQLISDHRVITTWYPVKGQKKLTLDFSVIDEDARTSRILISERPTKNRRGNLTRYEEVDLAKHLFTSK